MGLCLTRDLICKLQGLLIGHCTSGCCIANVSPDEGVGEGLDYINRGPVQGSSTCQRLQFGLMTCRIYCARHEWSQIVRALAQCKARQVDSKAVNI